MPDHVYIVRGVGSPTFKVGWTRTPEKRMKAHANSLGLCETHVFPVADGRAVEMAILAHLRLSGALLRHSSGTYSEVARVGDEMTHLFDSLRRMSRLSHQGDYEPPQCEDLEPDEESRDAPEGIEGPDEDESDEDEPDEESRDAPEGIEGEPDEDEPGEDAWGLVDLASVPNHARVANLLHGLAGDQGQVLSYSPRGDVWHTPVGELSSPAMLPRVSVVAAALVPEQSHPAAASARAKLLNMMGKTSFARGVMVMLKGLCQAAKRPRSDDTLRDFLEEHVEEAPGQRVLVSALFNRFEATGLHKGSGLTNVKRLSAAMEAKGFEKGRVAAGVVFLNLRIVQSCGT